MNNQVLISEIEEIQADLGEPDCKLINPLLIDNISMDLVNWMQDFSSPIENSFMIHSDKIVTITTPKESLLKKYIEKISS